MIHHLGVFAADFSASRAFSGAALAPLGIVVGTEADGVCELWRARSDAASMSLGRAKEAVTRELHLAFAAADRGQVDTFFESAVAAGGSARPAPRFWPEYRAYCAFVSDPDDNDVEALLEKRGRPA